MIDKEYAKLENWVQDIANRLSFASALGRVILECYRDGNIKECDIDSLITILNICLSLTRTKVNHLERYLMCHK